MVTDIRDADLAIIHPAEIGQYAARGELAYLPDRLIQPTHPLQWNAILPAYSRMLASWGGRIVGLPVAGDGAALVLRRDRLGTADRPTSWSELADLAATVMARNGQPSLAPLPADPTTLVTLFCRIAACYDRKAVTLGAGSRLGEQSLGFQFNLATGKPRLTTPGFVAAAEWLAKTQRYRPTTPADDAVAALESGTAVAAVLTLAEIARLPKDPQTGAVASRYQIMKPPASKYSFDPNGVREDASGGGNFIPYFGSSAMMGVVFASSKNADVAWDFLGEISSVTESLAIMSHPSLGAGPFRGEQIEEARYPVWLNYGFDALGTRALADAIRYDLALEVGNPTAVLRIPNQAEYVAILADALRQAVLGTVSPADALQSAARDWEALAEKTPQFREWLRAGAGLQ
jgi:ABC-type glycerol-3-phosphate transport system substrate-binding protein